MKSTNVIRTNLMTIELGQLFIQGLCEQIMFTGTSICRGTALNVDVPS